MDQGKRRQPSERPNRGRKSGQGAGGTARRIGFILGTAVLIGLCTAAIMAAIFMTYVNTTLTPTLQVRKEDYTMSQSSIVYYHDDAVAENEGWVEYQKLYGLENRILVDFDQIPDALWQAAVAIEDQRFFEHEGVDWLRTASAVRNLFLGGKKTFGGSTITQQMLKNMTGDNDVTINRKVREIFRALEFEKNYTKEQILELYLNFIYLGQNCYGVQTAAEFYFGKDVSELSVAECASLIAITNNPSMYGPMSTVVITREDGSKVTARQLNKERQELILDKMSNGDALDPETGKPFLTEEQAAAAKAEELHFADGSTSAEELVAAATGGLKINSWFVDQVFNDVAKDLAAQENIDLKTAQSAIYNRGYHIYTTLDPKIQEIAESVYEDRGNLDNLTSKKGQPIRSGITIIEPTTGNIVAIVGDMGEKEGNLLLSYATDRRQPGSSIKPLTVYAPALDMNVVTPASTFDNYPIRLLNNKPWPKNSPNKYTGWTTLGVGVQNSINTVAAQVVEKLGVTNSFAFATEKLNLQLDPNDMNTAALGLGGLTRGFTTVEMAAAYAAFANHGVYNSPRTYLRVTQVDPVTGEEVTVLENEGESHVAMKETTAYMMTDMLQKVVSNGTGGGARFGGMHIAGKTGTTSDNYDRYFAGYTPYYCAAVWTGYKYSERISYPVNPAAAMWKKVMQKIHEDLPDKSFEKPSGLVSVQVCADSGLLPTDACRADPRNNRIITVEVPQGQAPTEECNLHAFRDFCTEGNCLAGEFCPPESVVQKGFLDYVREDYGESIVAEDDPYLIVNMEKALEESGGCPVHTEGTVAPPVDPDFPVTDPNDPNYYDPTADPNYDPSGGFGDENMHKGDNNTTQPPAPPTTPTTPTEPAEPEPTDPSEGMDWIIG